jgi:hypothetical protein
LYLDEPALPNVTQAKKNYPTFALALQKEIKPDVKFYQIPRGANPANGGKG